MSAGSRQAARARERRFVLDTAANTWVAIHVADHLGLFLLVIVSDDEPNLPREQKRQRLVAEFAEEQHDPLSCVLVALMALVNLFSL